MNGLGFNINQLLSTIDAPAAPAAVGIPASRDPSQDAPSFTAFEAILEKVVAERLNAAQSQRAVSLSKPPALAHSRLEIAAAGSNRVPGLQAKGSGRGLEQAAPESIRVVGAPVARKSHAVHGDPLASLPTGTEPRSGIEKARFAIPGWPSKQGQLTESHPTTAGSPVDAAAPFQAQGLAGSVATSQTQLPVAGVTVPHKTATSSELTTRRPTRYAALGLVPDRSLGRLVPPTPDQQIATQGGPVGEAVATGVPTAAEGAATVETATAERPGQPRGLHRLAQHGATTAALRGRFPGGPVPQASLDLSALAGVDVPTAGAVLQDGKEGEEKFLPGPAGEKLAQGSLTNAQPASLTTAVTASPLAARHGRQEPGTTPVAPRSPGVRADMAEPQSGLSATAGAKQTASPPFAAVQTPELEEGEWSQTLPRPEPGPRMGSFADPSRLQAAAAMRTPAGLSVTAPSPGAEPENAPRPLQQAPNGFVPPDTGTARMDAHPVGTTAAGFEVQARGGDSPLAGQKVGRLTTSLHGLDTAGVPAGPLPKTAALEHPGRWPEPLSTQAAVDRHLGHTPATKEWIRPAGTDSRPAPDTTAATEQGPGDTVSRNTRPPGFVERLSSLASVLSATRVETIRTEGAFVDSAAAHRSSTTTAVPAAPNDASAGDSQDRNHAAADRNSPVPQATPTEADSSRGRIFHEAFSQRQGGDVGPQAGFDVPSSGGESSIQARAERLLDQVARGMRITLARGGSEVAIQLKPESLGTIRMRLAVEEGVVRAAIEVENAEVRRVLEKSLASLGDRLAEQGYRLDRAHVTIDTAVADRNGSPWSTRHEGPLFGREQQDEPHHPRQREHQRQKPRQKEPGVEFEVFG